jgi:tagatose 6-phosphate kinase
MILTITLNSALDLTYRLGAVRWHGANRVREVRCRAGGKGINVARVLHALGRDALVTGFAGGPTGEQVRADLAAAGLHEQLVPIAGDTRRTVAIVETAASGGATLLSEPGPRITGAEWRRLLGHVGGLLDGAEAMVLSGSVPPGVPPDGYATLARQAAAAGVPVLLDADAAALRRGVAGRPAVAKPNWEELHRATSARDPLTGAETLRRAGAEAVVVSLGPDGLLASTPAGGWRAALPERLAGNPTGAGDAAVAALAVGVASGQPWPLRLTHATALSAAAVRAPLAGSFDQAVYQDLLGRVRVTPLATGEQAQCGDPPGDPPDEPR